MNRSIRTTLLTVSIMYGCLHHAAATVTDSCIDLYKEFQNFVTSDQGYQTFVTYLNKKYPGTIDSSGTIINADNIVNKIINLSDFFDDLNENPTSNASHLAKINKQIDDTLGTLELYCLFAEEIAARLTEKEMQQKYPNPTGMAFKPYLIDYATIANKSFKNVIQKFDHFIQTTFVS